MGTRRSDNPAASTSQGQALIISLLVMGILTFLIFGLVEIVLPGTKVAAMRVTRTDLAQVLSNIQTCVLDGASWAQTIQDPANNLQCLQGGGPCTDKLSGAVRSLYTLDGKPGCGGFDNSSPYAGFDLSGQPCTGFNQPGSAASCPYHIDLTWTVACPAGMPSPCFFPQITIQGRVRYQPSHWMLPYLINPQSSYVLSFTLTRGQQATRRRFVIYELTPPGNALTHTGYPAEECTPSGAVLGLNWVEHDDGPFVTLPSPPDGTFTLAPGVYDCRGSAPTYMAGWHQVFLHNFSTGNTYAGTSELGNYGVQFSSTSRSYVSAHFSLGSPARMALVQICSLTVPSMTPTQAASFLRDIDGIPTGNGPELYATLTCEAGNTQDL